MAFYGKKRYGKRKPYRRTYRRRRYYRPYRRMGVEWKNINGTITENVNTTSSMGFLSSIAQGTDIDDRIGNKVLLKSIQMKLSFAVTPTTGVDSMVRFILFFYVNAKGGIPTVADLLEGGDGITHLRNDNKMCDFKVLVDKSFRLNAAGESGSQRFINIYKKLNKYMRFNTTTGLIGSVEKNALWFYVYGTEVSGTTDATLSGYYRLSFTDL